MDIPNVITAARKLKGYMFKKRRFPAGRLGEREAAKARVGSERGLTASWSARSQLVRDFHSSAAE